jgi:hypothetical protein
MKIRLLSSPVALAARPFPWAAASTTLLRGNGGRHFALPALPIVIKTLLPAAIRVARIASPVALYCMRWWPYYAVKYALLHTVRRYGAKRVYKHVVLASRRLLQDEAERARVRHCSKLLLRAPAAAQSVAADKLTDIDRFLTAWAMEGHQETRTRGWRSVDDQLELQLKHSVGASRCSLVTWCILHQGAHRGTTPRNLNHPLSVQLTIVRVRGWEDCHR